MRYSRIVWANILFDETLCWSHSWYVWFARALIWIHISRSSEKVPLNMRKMHRFKSSCASGKYHPDLCPPFIQFVVFNDSVSGLWWPWFDCADAQADMGHRCPHMSENILSHSAAHILSVVFAYQLNVFSIWSSPNIGISFKSLTMFIFKVTFLLISQFTQVQHSNDTVSYILFSNHLFRNQIILQSLTYYDCLAFHPMFLFVYNNLSVLSRQCLDVAGSSMFTFRVLPHWYNMSQTHARIIQLVAVYWRLT